MAMDPIPSVQAIVAVFQAVPDSAVEEYLLVIGSLLSSSDPAYRPVVAGMFRTAAESGQTETRRTMLLNAAADLEAAPVPASMGRLLSEPVSRVSKPKKISMANARFKELNTRKASVLQVGFRPTFDPAASNFGVTPLGLPRGRVAYLGVETASFCVPIESDTSSGRAAASGRHQNHHVLCSCRPGRTTTGKRRGLAAAGVPIARGLGANPGSRRNTEGEKRIRVPLGGI